MEYLKFGLHSYDTDGSPRYYAKIAGKSGDTKPTVGLISGSEFIEVDTGKTYVFDGLSTTPAWTEKVVLTATAAE